jgi:hypothetical protein
MPRSSLQPTWLIHLARSVLQIWDASTGMLLKMYPAMMPSSITALCLDNRERKFILGSHEGDVQVR